MKIYKIYGILGLSLVMGLFAGCKSDEGFSGNDRQRPENAKIVNISQGAESGQILVKFRPEVSEMLDKAQAMTTKAGGTPGYISRSGVMTIDGALKLIEAYGLERVFPLDDVTDERTRECGLHLWYTVNFKEGENLDDVARTLSQLGEISTIEFVHEIKRYQTNDAVVSAEPRRIMTKAGTFTAPPFNDPRLVEQWNFINSGDGVLMANMEAGSDVNCAEAWTKCKGDASIIVAVVDEGVDFAHPDLAANMWVNKNEVYKSFVDNDGNGYEGDVYGWNCVQNTGVIVCDDVNDTGHGTHVAGTIAAVNGNAIGVSGIAGGDGSPDSGVKIMSIQIYSGNRGANNTRIARGVKYAADNGAVILQCSWGYNSAWGNIFLQNPSGYYNDEIYEANNPLHMEAFNYFIRNAGSPNGVIDGGVVIFASGNESAPGASYPGAHKKFISVSAITGDYSPASYTNYWHGVKISAPGGDNTRHKSEAGDILSTLPVSKGSYGYMQGTSMACPHVSGVAALGLAYASKLRKHFTAENYHKMILEAVKPLDQKLSGKKMYYELWSLNGETNPNLLDLGTYRGKMGSGLIDAGMLLNAVANQSNGVKISLPNAYVDLAKEQTIDLTFCFDNGRNLTYTASSADTSIATVKVEGGSLVVSGVKAGVTKFTVTPSSGTAQTATVTVRKNANPNGWL